MPQPTTARRSTFALCVLVAMLVVPQLLVSSASGDGIGDKRAEARRIAARLNALRQQVEILAEDYDNAQIHLAEVGSQVSAAERALARTNRELGKRQRNLARYAVSAYTSGGEDSLTLVLKGDGSDLGAREGYASVAVGDRADLVDSLRAAKADSESRATDLRLARRRADGARARVDNKRKAATAAATDTQKLYDRVQGELKTLVAAEEARLAAVQRARAEAEARAAAERVRAAAPPAAPRSVARSDTARARSTPTTTAPAPRARVQSTTTPPNRPTPRPRPQPTAPAPAPVAPVGNGAAAAIAAARSVLGVRYTWAGASPGTGFDCSGLIMWAWAHGGKSLPHSSQALYGMARKIPLSALQPGDLVFYGSPIHHVALYIGGGQIIHAPHTGSYVQVESMYYWSALVGAGRI